MLPRHPSPSRYVIENRYQDSGWELVSAQHGYNDLEEATLVAEILAANGLAYGMTRVVDRNSGEVLVTFPAG